MPFQHDMWVVLRLVTALVVGLLKFFWRGAGGGETKRSAEIEWRLKQGKHKGRVVSTTFGVPFTHPVFFRLTKEDFWDRYFKKIGFTREVQTGDASFDEAIYVSCDHPAMAPVLQADADMRAAIDGLFSKGAQRIFADGKVLWAHFPRDVFPGETELGRLATIRDALNAVPPEHLQTLRDPFFWKALLVESVVWSIVIYGAPALVEIATRSHPQYFEWGPVIKTGLLAAVGIFAFLFGLSWWLLRGSSRAHVLTESFVALLIGVPLSSIQMLSDSNIALDRSAPVVVEQMVADKYTRVTVSSKGRRRTHYHLRFSGAVTDPFRIPADIEVAVSVYQRASKGHPLFIQMRQGAAGIPWVEDMRPAR
ncbi:MAG TPA: hypothetical protein VM029_14470 [Opitutaceae bacterium]|nr:hypothetical protein [Opitutaceae bacterium]